MSILFSATYDSDAFNSESELAFDLLAEADFSIFTNVNVRSEFLENHRRVLIPEILIDLLVAKGSQLDSILHEKLKSHRTSYQKKVAEEKNTKMDPIQIKMWRHRTGKKLKRNFHPVSVTTSATKAATVTVPVSTAMTPELATVTVTTPQMYEIKKDPVYN